MRVLVTGGCGFLGSHVAEYFAKNGDEVVCLDNLSTLEIARTDYDLQAARFANRSFLDQIGSRFVLGDVRQKEVVLNAAANCDFIVHTAAQPAVTIALEEPELDFQTNAIGALNVLLAARTYAIPVILCSTIHVYGNSGINAELMEQETRFSHPRGDFAEDYPIFQGKITPLHASKGSAELLTAAFVDSYGIRAANFRLSGLYGRRQIGGMDHGWVANFCIRALRRQEILLYGTGKQVRDILHASDVARAMHLFYLNGESGTYNIGGGLQNSISLQESLTLIAELVQDKLQIRMLPAREADLHYFVCNIDKAFRLLKWKPMIAPKTGLADLMGWVREHRYIFESKA